MAWGLESADTVRVLVAYTVVLIVSVERVVSVIDRVVGSYWTEAYGDGNDAVLGKVLVDGLSDEECEFEYIYVV